MADTCFIPAGVSHNKPCPLPPSYEHKEDEQVWVKTEPPKREEVETSDWEIGTPFSEGINPVNHDCNNTSSEPWNGVAPATWQSLPTSAQNIPDVSMSNPHPVFDNSVSSAPEATLDMDTIDQFLLSTAKPKKYQCPQCPKSFHTKTTLGRHSRIHSGTALSCPVCYKQFYQKSNYNNHLYAKHGQVLPSSSKNQRLPSQTPQASVNFNPGSDSNRTWYS